MYLFVGRCLLRVRPPADLTEEKNHGFGVSSGVRGDDSLNRRSRPMAGQKGGLDGRLRKKLCTIQTMTSPPCPFWKDVIAGLGAGAKETLFYAKVGTLPTKKPTKSYCLI